MNDEDIDLNESLLRELKAEARRRGFLVLTLSRDEAIIYAVFFLGLMYGLAIR